MVRAGRVDIRDRVGKKRYAIYDMKSMEYEAFHGEAS